MYKIKIIPAWTDNYLFVIHDGKEALAIDPGNPSLVDDFLGEMGLNLIAVLNTHHHPDHTGGNAFLQNKYECPVYCASSDLDRIPGKLTPLSGNSQIFLLGLKIDILNCIGHTKGHISFYFAELQSLFCGDTLFSMGCGRLFEGTAAQMNASLDIFRNLPLETKLYCAHEYTLANAKFCRDTLDRADKYQEEISKIKRELAQGNYTVPSSLEYEKEWNPFFHLELDLKELKKIGAEAGSNSEEVFRLLRIKKDQYKTID